MWSDIITTTNNLNSRLLDTFARNSQGRTPGSLLLQQATYVIVYYMLAKIKSFEHCSNALHSPKSSQHNNQMHFQCKR
jgi:hypothetical protein